MTKSASKQLGVNNIQTGAVSGHVKLTPTLHTALRTDRGPVSFVSPEKYHSIYSSVRICLPVDGMRFDKRMTRPQLRKIISRILQSLCSVKHACLFVNLELRVI